MNTKYFLNVLDKIGTERLITERSIRNVIIDLTGAFNSNEIMEEAVYHQKILSHIEFSSNFHYLEEVNLRIDCAINILYILHCTSYICNPNTNTEEENAVAKSSISRKSERIPEVPLILSLKHLKTIEVCFEFVIYTIFLSSLDEEAASYLKVKISQENLPFWRKEIEIPSKFKHQTLVASLSHLLPLFKIDCLKARLLALFLPEVLSGLLQVCFSPKEASFIVDVQDLRQELELLSGECLPSDFLQALLLLNGAHRKGSSWLRKISQSFFVRRFLLPEGGVRLTLSTLLRVGSLKEWREKEAAAAVIAAAKTSSHEELFGSVCPQLLILVREEEKGDMFQLLSLVIQQLTKRSLELMQERFFRPFVAPLSNLTVRSVTSCPSGKGIAGTVSTLRRIYVEALPPDAQFLGVAFLLPVLCPLMVVAALPPTCHVKTSAQLTLLRFLTQLDDDESVSALLVVTGVEADEKSPPINPDLRLVSRSNDIEVELQVLDGERLNEINERIGNCLVEILSKLKSRMVVIKLLLRLSAYLDFTVLNDIDVKPNQLLADSDVNVLKLQKLKRLMLVVCLLKSLTENEEIGSDLFSNLASAVPVIRAILLTHKQETTDADLAQTKEGFLTSCLVLLFCFVVQHHENGVMTHSDWEGLDHLLPILREMKAKNGSDSLRDIVDNVLRLFLTRGVLKKYISSTFHEVSECGKSSHKPTTPTRTSFRPSNLSGDPGRSLYGDALVDVCSPHLPVRSHGLRSFAKLIEAKDEETLKNYSHVTSLLEHHLRDDDSYIYLAAIEGMVSLASHSPQKVVTLLTEEFARSNQAVETRLKLAESLTKASKLLGPLLPKYKNLFLNCLMNGCKDEDPLIRASCLSSLGEVCKALRFSVEHIMFEMMHLVESMLQHDKSPEVKRAAVLFVTLLLQGLGKDMIKVLQNVILEIYRTLKKMITNEDDPVLKTHAEIAMEEINVVTREFLLPKLQLQKKIFVTEIPTHFS